MSEAEIVNPIAADLTRVLMEKLAKLKQESPGQYQAMLQMGKVQYQAALRALVQEQIEQHKKSVQQKYWVTAKAWPKAQEAGEKVRADEIERIEQEKREQDPMYQLTLKMERAGLLHTATPGKHLFRNVSSFVTPQVVFNDNRIKHKNETSPKSDVIAYVFSRGGKTAWSHLQEYVNSPETLPYTVVSATADADNSLGHDPYWTFAFTRPQLTAVTPADIANYLGTLGVPDVVTLSGRRPVTAENVQSSLGGKFSLRTDGGLPGTMTAFVNNAGSAEHIFMNSVPLDGDAYFRCVQDLPRYPYRRRWKLLAKWEDYARMVEEELKMDRDTLLANKLL